MSRRIRKKLLIIACSNRKLRTKGLLPAIERYDGVTYRVIRKAMREGYFPSNVDIKILSAEFGLIDADTLIPYYDRRMDKARAEELKSPVHKLLQMHFAKHTYAEIYIDLGADYLPAIQDFVFPSNTKQIFAKERIGIRLGNLRKWLLTRKDS